MSQLQSTTTRPRSGAGVGGDLTVVAGAVLAAAATWAVWTQGFGTELAADTGSGVRAILLTHVVLTALAASVAGLLLCRLLVARAARGLRWWTWTAATVWLLSLLGTAGAVTAAATTGLVALHLVVGAVVIMGARWARREG
jgi:hypothetical protein